MDLTTRRVEITAHNHGFAVDAPLGQPTQTPYGIATVSHVGLNDDVVEGLELRDADGDLLSFSVQYHPEAAAGPHDARYLFDRFVRSRDGAAATSRRSPRRLRARSLMPKRTDIDSILVIGSGPIVIGQACEFDYSGTQACRVLRAEGFRVILVNSNPATIMTDPEFADATYIEPITPEFVEQVIATERPGRPAGHPGRADRAQRRRRPARERGPGEVRRRADRRLHRGHPARREPRAVQGDRGEPRASADPPSSAGDVGVARSLICHSMDDVLAAADDLGYPLVVRPSFTMGGVGSGFAHDENDLRRIAGAGLAASPTTEVLIEESILGWKEYELEVMRDRADNVVIVCSIENLDPMGVHTGDSITVAPAMTLTDREYQRMRDVAIGIIRAVGVDTGGCNIQFAIDPATGRMIVIEMNPRVSRSSALASKATGFPIAKIAAKVAIGYTLDEIPNDITEETPASFEPTLDYVVVKVPRFAFEKFPAADDTLTTHMKSVGEAMAHRPQLHRGARQGAAQPGGPEGPLRLDPAGQPGRRRGPARPRPPARTTAGSAWCMQALRAGATAEQVYEATKIDPWFVDQLVLLIEVADAGQRRATELTADAAPDRPSGTASPTPRSPRSGTCARTWSAASGGPSGSGRSTRRWTPARPSSPPRRRTTTAPTTTRPRSSRATRPAVLILGSGPNRIGQGIEFDYSCVHAAMALSAAGYETIMVNCNPETVSTDYDTADRLYFEPLTLEDVLEVVARRAAAGPIAGVIVQLGGQTPLRLAQALKDAGVPIVGTSPEAIHLAEERGAFGQVLDEANLPAPKHGLARSFAEARADRRDDRLPGAGPARATCSAAAGWRSSTTRARWPPTSTGPPRSPRSTRCWSTSSSTTRWRSTSTPCTTAASSTSAG